jgi:hypothetical protein
MPALPRPPWLLALAVASSPSRRACACGGEWELGAQRTGRGGRGGRGGRPRRRGSEGGRGLWECKYSFDKESVGWCGTGLEGLGAAARGCSRSLLQRWVQLDRSAPALRCRVSTVLADQGICFVFFSLHGRLLFLF